MGFPSFSFLCYLFIIFELARFGELRVDNYFNPHLILINDRDMLDLQIFVRFWNYLEMLKKMQFLTKNYLVSKFSYNRQKEINVQKDQKP